MGHKNIGLILRILPDLVQQIVDSLGQLQHGFAALVPAAEFSLCLEEFPAVPGRGLPFPKALLLKPWLLPGGDAGDLRDVPGRLRRAHKRGIQDLVRLYSLLQNPFSSFHRLAVAKLCQRDIRGPADFIFHIPKSLAVPYKIYALHAPISPRPARCGNSAPFPPSRDWRQR